mmetsp:Transcript_8803/g.30695  ORF Transcript_8803/g.30695 Transcript_8803/m.30695 type:complete len:256 (+) Transcript_8803:258-1025(+)
MMASRYASSSGSRQNTPASLSFCSILVVTSRSRREHRRLLYRSCRLLSRWFDLSYVTSTEMSAPPHSFAGSVHVSFCMKRPSVPASMSTAVTSCESSSHRMGSALTRARRSRRMFASAAESATSLFMNLSSPTMMIANTTMLTTNHSPGWYTRLSNIASPQLVSRIEKSPVTRSSSAKPRVPAVMACRIFSDELELSLARNSSSRLRVLFCRDSCKRNIWRSEMTSVFSRIERRSSWNTVSWRARSSSRLDRATR